MSHAHLRVAIQGDKGSFHEAAAKLYYSAPIELIYCETFADTFDAVLTHLADRAFVATSNTLHGTIKEVADLQSIHHFQSHGSYDLRIEQCLIALPGVTVHDIRTVMSHPAALSQCDTYLSTELPQACVVEYHDTAAAVKYIKEMNDPSIAAIASEAAALLYNLPVLAKGIQTVENNVTTFVSLAQVIQPAEQRALPSHA